MKSIEKKLNENFKLWYIYVLIYFQLASEKRISLPSLTLCTIDEQNQFLGLLYK